MSQLHLNIPKSISPPQRSATSSNSSYKRMIHAQALAMYGSFNNGLSRSFGRDFSMRLASPLTMASPSADQAYISGLEDRFCRDFQCCGIQLENLHDLLQHFEECHVHVESDGEEEIDEEGFTFEFETIDDMDTDMDDAFGNATISSSFLQKQSIALSEIYSSRMNSAMSAFDTSVVRRNSKRVHPPTFIVKQEPQSIPLTFEGPTRIVTDMEMDGNEPMSFKSEDSITDVEEERDDRPYKCKVPGCPKAYKNPGGLKYHSQHGHCEDTGDPEMNNIINKPYQCTVADCGKRYKNLNGLKYHIEHAHVSLLEN